ncbi:MAG: hypothetical protein IT453_04920 [Planctomycetes bacterium]|nr:hypothetical protein [Planctomycetota bacterium]
MATTSFAQQAPSTSPSDVTNVGAGYNAVQNALGGWRDAHGTNWQAVYDKEVGYARFLHGGGAAPLFTPANDADFYSLARHWLGATKQLHGVETQNLIEDGVVFLPLSLAGSNDKYTVQFRQAKDGVPVLDGYATVLFDAQGRLLSIDTTGVRDLSKIDTLPSLSAAIATELALGWFRTDTATEATFVGEPKLMIDQAVRGKFRLPALAWEITVISEEQGRAAGYVYRVDANEGTLSSRAAAIHHFDVSGNVKSMATPGNFPDIASNPETAQNMPYLAVTSSSGNAKTDANGNFTIVGASAPVSATFRYQNGTYATVNNNAGAAYTLTQNLTAASGNNVTMNSPVNDLVTAQANCLLWIGKMRDWTRSVNPADATSDFLATANANIASTCNAYYNGSSVNFYQAGGGCTNTANSSVVIHEMGHWMNDRYSSGNGSDGFGEGNADNFSTYILEDPIVGHDFCGTGCNVRDANNTRQFCGDSNPGCYGEVHADGEVIMGAMWKARTRLKAALGASIGAQTANVLFNSWMNAYNDTQIKSIIETHWLTLDDDDANINNGTPNYAHIDGGFTDQGFPGFQIQFVTITNVTQIPSSTNPGPFIVNADATALINPPVGTVELHYRVNGGAFSSMQMSHVIGNTYQGQIPAQACPSSVEYYVKGFDANLQSGTYPAGAPNSVLKFFVGQEVGVVSYDFEANNGSWTSGATAGTNDFQYSGTVGVNITNGESGDPTTPAVSGTKVWGNDLGVGNWNGAYSDNLADWLRSPTFNCSGKTGVHLRFNRWLGVESGQYDQARVKVNGTTVWTNPQLSDLIDSSWVPVDLDISAIADNNASVQIEFSMTSDVGVTFGGWTIDDVQVVSLSCPSCPTPSNYCVSKLTSGGSLPVVAYSGSPTFAANNFVVELQQGTSNKNAILFWGAASNNAPFNGGTLCVAPPLKRGPLVVTDTFGFTTTPFPLIASDVGKTYFFQYWMRDPADPFTIGLSNGLQAQICP